MLIRRRLNLKVQDGIKTNQNKRKKEITACLCLYIFSSGSFELDSDTLVHVSDATSDSQFPFSLCNANRKLNLMANDRAARCEWIIALENAINNR